jgi:hypothetical protein
MTDDTKRTCATCCSFDEGGECLNGLGRREPGDRCDDHETVAEFDADVAALQRFRISIGLSTRS